METLGQRKNKWSLLYSKLKQDEILYSEKIILGDVITLQVNKQKLTSRKEHTVLYFKDLQNKNKKKGRNLQKFYKKKTYITHLMLGGIQFSKML
jgi:hypothetical protein